MQLTQSALALTVLLAAAADTSGEPLYGPDDIVQTIAVAGTSTYIGGTFTTVGRLAANHVARWDGQRWMSLGSGMDDTVLALAVDSRGDLYAGGLFRTAGGRPASAIARWDGTSWSPLGGGIDGSVRAIAFHPSSGELYVGGSFHRAEGRDVYCVARWDGSKWRDLDLGLNETVRDLAFGPDGLLYAAGGFSTAGARIVGSFTSMTEGGQRISGVARWDGRTWSGLQCKLATSNAVNAIEFVGRDLYALGNFSKIGGVSAKCLARFNLDSSEWTAVSFNASAFKTGVDGGLDLLADGHKLYVAGSRRVSTTSNPGPISFYDTRSEAWTCFAPSDSGTSFCLARDRQRLLVGGRFSTVRLGESARDPKLMVRNLAVMDMSTGRWSGLGGGAVEQPRQRRRGSAASAR